jgi:Ca-activated chloride channel homolog
MNNDEKNKDMQNPISAELEARIVAWVSGDATAADSAELEALVAGSPALAAFKARVEAAARLAAEAMAMDKKPLRMSEARRAALLQEIGATTKDAPAQAGAADVPVLVAIQRRQRRERRWMLAVAACLTTGLFLTLMIPSYQKSNGISAARESGPREMYLEVAKSKAEEANRETAESVEFDAQDQKKGGVAFEAPQPEAAPRIEMPVQLPVFEPAAPEIRQAKVEGRTRTYGAVLNNARQLTAVDLDKGLLAESKSDHAPEPIDLSAHNGTLGIGGTVTAAPGEKAAVESEAPIVLSPFVVNEEEETGGYRANSTLAGTRVRTDLKDAAASISVVSDQFLKDTIAANAVHILAYSAKAEVAGISDAVAAVSPATNSPDKENAVLSAFEVDASQDEASYKAIEVQPAAQAADAELQSVLNAPGKVSPGASSAGSVVFGTGSPAGILGSRKMANPNVGSPYVSNATSVAEVSAAKEPVSTFSLHVSDVSFRLAQAALARGEAPDPSQVRPEEFYNAFDYGDPAPAMSEKVSCHTEQSVDPVMQQRNLLRIAMKVPATGHGASQPLRLTVLLDTSGSMEREDRSTAVRGAMKVLVSLLGRDDRVTLVGFARSPRLLAEQVHGDKAGSLLDIISKTPADGGTNLEEALKLGSELAQRQFTAGAQNRIVLLTDGAANLGDADPVHLAALVESLRQRDIAFDACGVGSGGIDDSVLEALTRKGSGRYYVLDSPEAADAGFARQLAGAFRPAAENVKVQVRFNPARVGSYRLIGFEKHRLNKEDFRNDTVAAAALASGEAAIALYEVEALPQGEGDLGEVYVRFHDTATGRMVERSWALPYDPYAPAFDRATPSMQLAGTAALLAEKLRGGARADAIKLAELAPVVNALRNHYSHEVPVQELAAMYQQMRRLRGE